VNINEVFVVVTVADNGMIHAYGSGPVTRPGVPYSSRVAAQRDVRRARREDRKRGTAGRVRYKVCKVLGSESTSLPPLAPNEVTDP
jgi:hypothetical protein